MYIEKPLDFVNVGELLPRADLSSLDFVERPVETTASVHVLSPGALFLDRSCTLLVALDVLAFGRPEPTHAHHGQHCVVLLCAFLFLFRSIWVEVYSFWSV